MTLKTFAAKNRLKLRIDQDDQTEIIPGRVGHLYEHDPVADNGQIFAVMIMPDPPRRQYWGFARRALKACGCVIVQDGDGEGAATFDPKNLTQVKRAIQAAHVKRRRNAPAPSPAQLEARQRFARMKRLMSKKGRQVVK